MVEGPIFAEKDKRIEIFGLNLVRQIDRLNVQVGEHGKNLGDGQAFVDSQDVEEARNVLLDVQLDFQRLKGHVFDAPHVRDLAVGNLFELADLLQEIVHIFHVVIEDLLSRILYFLSNKKRVKIPKIPKK